MQVSAHHINRTLLQKTASSLKAMAHPMRLAILSLLKDGNKLNVTQIHTALQCEQAVASQHLSILKEKNIVESQRQGKNTFYFLRQYEIVHALELISSSKGDWASL